MSTATLHSSADRAALADASTTARAVDELKAAALRHRAIRHPYLKAMAAGDLPDSLGALADFARQYHGYSSHFPRYLCAVIARLERPEHRQALLDNLSEESGHYEAEELATLQGVGINPAWIEGIAHPELFRRFRAAVEAAAGRPPCDPEEPEQIEVICWREQFLACLSQGSPAEAIGALGLGTEAIVPLLYAPFAAAIARCGALLPRDTVFFPLHTLVDDHHQGSLRRIAIDLAATPTGLSDLSRGMHKALALRDAFWSWLLERALQGPGEAQLAASTLDAGAPDRR